MTTSGEATKNKPHESAPHLGHILRERNLFEPITGILIARHTTLCEAFVDRLRESHVTAARHEVFWTLRCEPFELSLVTIGRLLGFDHTTVLQGARKHGQSLAKLRAA